MEDKELLNCSFNRAIAKTKQFWDLYGEKFPEHYRKYFTSNIYDIIDNNDISKVDDVTKSILNYLNLLSIEADKESQFLSFFEQYFDYTDLYNKNIVAVTNDFLPTLAKKISMEKEQGIVKTFGPNLIVGENCHLKAYKKSFSMHDLTEDDEMVVSFSPRENAERIFHAALNKEKELLLNFDGYVPDRDAFFMPSEDAFVAELYDYAMRHKSDAFDADIVNYSLGGGTALVLKRK